MQQKYQNIFLSFYIVLRISPLVFFHSLSLFVYVNSTFAALC